MTLTSQLRTQRAPRPSHAPRLLMEEALAIGRRTSRDAIVGRERCNWLGRKIIYPSGVQPRDKPTIQALGPNVYDGTAGIAMMLARLDSVTGGNEFSARARQALNHALRYDWSRNDPERRYGYYTGLTGLAWAAHELSIRLGMPELAADRDRVLASLLDGDGGDGYGYPDVMFGGGGAIAVLCRMDQDAPGQTRAMELAHRLADDLYARAQWDGEETSWDGARSHGVHTRNLTGFSHGTSGIAWGLAEYAKYTGRQEAWRHVAGALRYEEGTFDPDTQNWLDLRNDFAPDQPRPRRFASVWCHGSPGIGLSRLALVGQPQFSEAAIADMTLAAQHTSELLSRWWLNPGVDTSVCHGVTGNAEARALMNTAITGRDEKTLREWAGWLVHRFGEQTGIDWPSAVTVGQYPTLMTGSAAVAHFLLRAADPDCLEPLVLPPHPRGIGP